MFCAACQHHGVMRQQQVARLLVDADMHIVMEGHAFGLDLLHAAVDEVLFHLEVGNAIAQQSARLGVLFKHVHVMARAGELLGTGKAGGAGADHRNFLAGLVLGCFRRQPSFGPAAIDDSAFDRLDGDGVFREVQRAGGLARGGADAAGEFRKVVRRVEVAAGFLPIVAIDQIVPVGNLVVHRAAVMAVGNAAIHAASRLIAHGLVAERDHELLMVADTV